MDCVCGIPIDADRSTIVPITIHATTRQQIRFRWLAKRQVWTQNPKGAGWVPLIDELPASGYKVTFRFGNPGQFGQQIFRQLVLKLKEPREENKRWPELRR
jgi:hypothetical protein